MFFSHLFCPKPKTGDSIFSDNDNDSDGPDLHSSGVYPHDTMVDHVRSLIPVVRS